MTAVQAPAATAQSERPHPRHRATHRQAPSLPRSLSRTRAAAAAGPPSPSPPSLSPLPSACPCAGPRPTASLPAAPTLAPLLLALLPPLADASQRLLLNVLALLLLLPTAPLSLYLSYAQTAAIRRGEGRVGRGLKEVSGWFWDGFDWLEDREMEEERWGLKVREWLGGGDGWARRKEKVRGRGEVRLEGSASDINADADADANGKADTACTCSADADSTARPTRTRTRPRTVQHDPSRDSGIEL